jgi:hypothetical protein
LGITVEKRKKVKMKSGMEKERGWPVADGWWLMVDGWWLTTNGRQGRRDGS